MLHLGVGQVTMKANQWRQLRRPKTLRVIALEFEPNRNNVRSRLLLHMNTDIAAQKALDRLAKVGFDLLAEREKILAAVWTFEAQVVNQGFARYFSSSAGDMAFYAPTAFKSIGALQKAEIAAKANGVFGAGGPPRDRKTRRELVRAFDAEAKRVFDALEMEFYQSPEDVDDLLEVYINKK
jgi:hypothetical protein